MIKAIQSLEGVSTAEALMIYKALMFYKNSQSFTDIETGIIAALIDDLEEELEDLYELD